MLAGPVTLTLIEMSLEGYKTRLILTVLCRLRLLFQCYWSRFSWFFQRDIISATFNGSLSWAAPAATFWLFSLLIMWTKRQCFSLEHSLFFREWSRCVVELGYIQVPRRHLPLTFLLSRRWSNPSQSNLRFKPKSFSLTNQTTHFAYTFFGSTPSQVWRVERRKVKNITSVLHNLQV